MHLLSDLKRYTLKTADGQQGKLVDCLFDDTRWIVRYLAVDFNQRTHLISPRAAGLPDTTEEQIPLPVTGDSVAGGPVYDPSAGLTRSLETSLHDYFQWPYYWEEEQEIPSHAPGDLTGVPLVEMVSQRREQLEASGEASTPGAPPLRSFNRVAGFTLQGRDGTIGRLEDFIVNDENWTIMYMIINLGGLLSNKRVIVSPSLVTSIDWDRSEMTVDLKQQTIHDSPPFDPAMLTREDFDSEHRRYYLEA